MCGNWNVRQAVSQQVFKVTTFCTDTCFQSFFAADQLHRPPCSAENQPMSQQDASTTPLYRGLVLDTCALAVCPTHGYLPGWGQDCWLATCHYWWTGVSYSAEARLCHEHDVLAHCLAARQTRLQQCCGSLIAASASATRLGNIAHWVLHQAQRRWGCYGQVWILQERMHRN